MIVKQLKLAGDNFIYLVGCGTTRDACVIDTLHNAENIAQIALQNDLNIRSIIHTHGHFDHVSDNQSLKTLTGAQIIMHHLDAAGHSNIDIHLKDEKMIAVGHLNLQVLHTPGHTPGGICLYTEGQLFTGNGSLHIVGKLGLHLLEAPRGIQEK